MTNSEYNGSTEYEKVIRFLAIGCNCGCSKKIPREKFAELRKAFQVSLDLMKTMNGGEITVIRRLKKNRVLIKEFFITEIVILIRIFVRKRIIYVRKRHTIFFS